MAENFKNHKNHKSKHKPTPSGDGESNDPFGVLAILFLVAFLVAYLTERIVAFSKSELPFHEAAYNYLSRAMLYLSPISLILSAVFIFGIVYSLRKLGKVRKELNLKYHSGKESISEFTKSDKFINKKWNKVLEYLESQNMSDWKLAILEADILLEQMIDKMGYPGNTLGEKLKNIEKSDFSTIDKAWEAHKIRNTIAHEGAKFLITQEEARRTIGLFESVFKEFRYI